MVVHFAQALDAFDEPPSDPLARRARSSARPGPGVEQPPPGRSPAAIVAELERLLRCAPDPEAVLQRFYDAVEGEPQLLAASERCETPELVLLLERVASAVAGRAVAAVDPVFFRVRGERLIHGVCLLDGQLALALYFEGGGGVVSLRSGDTVRYARFRPLGRFGPGELGAAADRN